MAENRVAVIKNSDNLSNSIYEALDTSGILSYLKSDIRIAIKPNFTYPYHKPGVTTSPEVIRETVKILRNFTSHIAIVETDGGYGAWSATEAFNGHGIYLIGKTYGIEVVNLCDEPSEPLPFYSGRRHYHLPLPSRLLHDTDLFISMPVPKIHCMTGLSLGYKNQWGCIPDIMRLRRHYIFDDAIVAINQALKPVVLADGIYFLDRNGPMEGDLIRMDLIIAATNVGAFDRYMSAMMGFPWRRIRHLRRAVELGDMPLDLENIKCNESPDKVRTHIFRLNRTLRNYIAIIGFKSRFFTWLGYESWFGKVILHGILYMIAGKPIKSRINEEV